MSEKEIPIHYVCTHEQAQRLIDAAPRFWVSNCGCREGNKEGCKRSRIDVCLFWNEQDKGSGSGKREITRAEAQAIMTEAKNKWLVTRPFRNEARTATDGICFCCDDCCGYFAPDSTYACDKGEMIEETTMADCTHCGECEKVCHFHARKMQDGELKLDRDKCYGCGLCVPACPTECIRLAKR
jgi:ferredoxin